MIRIGKPLYLSVSPIGRRWRISSIIHSEEEWLRHVRILLRLMADMRRSMFLRTDYHSSTSFAFAIELFFADSSAEQLASYFQLIRYRLINVTTNDGT